MPSTIKETLATPVKFSYSVCVCGGGVAGIAAAISAARAQKALGKNVSVVLIEKGFILGGLATAGLVTIYLPICDGYGKQVCYGLGEELLKLSIEHGAEDMYPSAWLDGDSEEKRIEKRFMVQFNAQFFALSAEKLLLDEGVKILYGATVAGVVSEQNNKITHIIIEGKSGREAISINTVVDATGDADVCKLAGAKTEKFAEGNKLAAWYYGYGNGKVNLYMCGVHDTPDTTENTDLKDTRRFSGLDTAELSELTCISHKELTHNILERKKTIPDLVPVTISTTPEVRMTRRLSGKYTQDASEFDATYSDSVGSFPNWRKRGPVYELPFGSLYGKEVKNLITAGRCISVTDTMWDITRVIPVCAVSGEAAGAAAAMFDNFDNADLKKLQSYLSDVGVIIHPKRNDTWKRK